MEPEKPAISKKSLEAAPQTVPVEGLVPSTHKKKTVSHSQKTLLYMYVEDYLGFRQEGFNFAMSPRFHMVIQDDQRILKRVTLTENESYWEDHPFFGKNISGLSVLIGANGSGKTTLIRLLLSWLRDLAANIQPDIPGVLVFRETRKKKKQVTHIDHCCSFLGKEDGHAQVIDETMQYMTVAEAASFLSDVSFTYYTDTLTDPELFEEGRWQDSDSPRLGSSNQYIDYSLNARLSRLRLDPTWEFLPRAALRRLDFATQAKNLNSLLKIDCTHNGFLIDHLLLSTHTEWGNSPIKIMLEEKIEKKYQVADVVPQKMGADLIRLPQTGDYDSLLSDFEHFYAAWKRRLSSIETKESVILTVLGSILLSFVSTILYTAKAQEYDIIYALASGLRQLINRLDIIDEAETDQWGGVDDWMKELVGYIGDVSALSEDAESEMSNQADYMYSLLAHLDWLKNPSWEIPQHTSRGKIFAWTLNATELISNETVKKDFLAFVDIVEKIPACLVFLSFEWCYISSGQDNYCNLLAMLTTLTGNGFNRWVFLDEPDNAFHPEWQRTLIQRILCCCSEHKPACFQLWVTTHSPIMLSDVPANASIRLTRAPGTDWKINESENKNHLSSFAQQIYTLFDDAFFMRNGVVGEFASEKIQGLCKRLDAVEKKETEADPSIQEKLKDISALIDQIQEPVLGGYLRMRLKLLHEVLSSTARGRTTYD